MYVHSGGGLALNSQPVQLSSRPCSDRDPRAQAVQAARPGPVRMPAKDGALSDRRVIRAFNEHPASITHHGIPTPERRAQACPKAPLPPEIMVANNGVQLREPLVCSIRRFPGGFRFSGGETACLTCQAVIA